MNKSLSACLLSLATFVSVGASAAEPLVRFEDGIGVQPLRAGARRCRIPCKAFPPRARRG